MGLRQDQNRLMRLHVLNKLYGALSLEQKAEMGDKFEKASATIMGQLWTDNGYSIESGVEVEYFVRGVMSANKTPANVSSQHVLRQLAYSAECILERSSEYASQRNGGVIGHFSLESSAEMLLKRYGLEDLSVEGKNLEALKLVGTVLGTLLNPKSWINVARGREPRDPLFGKTNKQKEQDTKENAPIDPKKIDWSNVAKVPKHLSEHLSAAKIDAMTQVEGKVSAGGIVKRLTWGHQFDERDPVGFLTRMLQQYEGFYRKYEPAVANLDRFIQADERTTRAAVKSANGDEDKIDAIIADAIKKLHAEHVKVVGVFASAKPVFPNARMTSPDSAKGMVSEVVSDPAFKPIDELRPLTKEEAKKLVELLSKAVSEMKKYTTIFDRRWSDHSDGDEFWDITETTSRIDDYAGYVYYQSVDNALISNVDNISDILASVAMGIITWIDRSFKDGSVSA